MAEEVATWRELYNIDGIDLDIENGAGDRKVRYDKIYSREKLYGFKKGTIVRNLNRRQHD